MSTTSHESTRFAAARLTVPRLRADRVRRSRLVELLEGSSSCRLVFIQAPAGFGKTTLIADWLASSRRPFAWLGIDREELDADAFLARLEAAIEYALCGAAGRKGIDAGNMPLSREGIMLSVSGRMSGAGRPLVLVLDDFHNLHDHEGQELVARLCDLLPAGASIVIASREGIPFPAARLRARGELAEFDRDDLRFTPSEVREFLNRISPARISDEDAAVLEERTEGWIAGLQLAVIALRDGRDPRRFIEAFGGTTRDVYDFLSQEALGALPRPDLELFTSLSVVDSFNASLCAALSGREDAGESLVRLERDCLFMVPLDDSRSWYRFHILFRQALLGRLRASDPGRERKLRHAASAWLEANGHPAEALRQAVLAGDADRAGCLAEDHAIAALERGDLRELREGFEAIGDGAIPVGPWFNLAAGWVAAYAGELAVAQERAACAEDASLEAAALLAASRAGFPERFRTSVGQEAYDAADLVAVRRAAARCASDASPGARKLAGRIEALRAYLVSLQAESRVAVDRAARALELLPEDDLGCRCLAEATLACALYGVTADCEAILVYEKAMETAQRAGARHVRYLAAAGLANLSLARGDLERAKAMCVAMIAEPGAERFPAIGDVHVILSRLEWERGEIGAALESGRRGLELCRRWGQADSLVQAYITLATAFSAAGDAEAGLDLLGRATRHESVSAWHKLNIDEAIASIEIERGNRAGSDAFCSRPQTIGTFEGYCTLAHWLILRRRAAEALPFIQVMCEKGELRGTLPRLAEGFILLALASKSRGEREAARAWLDKALALSSPQAYLMRFVRRGEGVAELLREREAKLPDPFVRALLLAFEASGARRAEKREAWRADGGQRRGSAVEVLSPRELEVLRLLGDGLTAVEIADRSFVAASTVRSHIKAIYGKLGTHRRVEALRRAGELGLL